MNTTSRTSIFDPALIYPAIGESFKKFNPRVQWRSPVMFVVLVGAVWTSAITIAHFSSFNLQISLWLWFTLLFANFAEAMAEGRGKAQAEALRRMRTTTMARLLFNGREERIPANALKKGDFVVCEANDIIPGDGDVIEGIASVDESAITGESAPLIRESGGDRSAVTGGTRVLSDRIVIRITSEQGNTFIDRMIAMVEGARRQKTPNEIALSILLVSLTALFILAVFTLPAFAHYSENAAGQTNAVNVGILVLVSLLVCLIPTTIGGLLSAIGISGIDRLVRQNVLATSGRAVEAAGDIDVLLLDKTGTITLGNRMAVEFHTVSGVNGDKIADAAQLASLADETPEGRSVVVLAKQKYGIRAREMHESQATFIPFTAQTRMSGIDLHAPDTQSTRSIRKGAADALRNYAESCGDAFPESAAKTVDEISRRGGTPLVVAESAQTLGVIELKDVVMRFSRG